MTWRLWVPVVVGVALLAYVLAETGRDAPAKEVRARQVSQPPPESLPLRTAEVPRLPEERGVVEAAEEPAAEPAPPGHMIRIQDWEAATDGVLEGRMIATRGIERWNAWRVYVTSTAPGVGAAIKRQKHVDVDAITGRFRIEGLPLGKIELVWYHPAAGMLVDRLEVEIESGLNTVEMRYAGPDPQAAIFVSVTCDEPVDPGAITATDGAQVFWAEALAEDYFAIPDLSPVMYHVTIDHPGKAPQTFQAGVGSRLRVELE